MCGAAPTPRPAAAEPCDSAALAAALAQLVLDRRGKALRALGRLLAERVQRLAAGIAALVRVRRAALLRRPPQPQDAAAGHAGARRGVGCELRLGGLAGLHGPQLRAIALGHLVAP